MSDSANIALVRKMYDSQTDPAAFKESMASDVIWDITPGFPSGGVYNGYDSVMNDYLSTLIPLFESYSAGPERYFADDENHVFVIGHYHAQTKDGRKAAVRFIHVWTVRDGKLAHLEQAADSAVLDRALNA